MVKRPGPDMLTVIDLPVLVLVSRATNAPVASCTMSPFGSGGKVLRTWLLTTGSDNTPKLQNRPAGASNGPAGSGDRVGLPRAWPMAGARTAALPPGAGAVGAVSEHPVKTTITPPRIRKRIGCDMIHLILLWIVKDHRAASYYLDSCGLLLGCLLNHERPAPYRS